MVETKDAKTVTGLPENSEAALCYVGGWVTGIVFLLMNKNSQKVRFNAAQSIVIFGLLSVVGFIPVIGWAISWLLWLVGFVLWLVLIVKTYQGETVELPIISDFVKKQFK